MQKKGIKRYEKKLFLLVVSVILIMPLIYGDVIWSDETGTEFTTVFSEKNPMCLNDKNSAGWWENDSEGNWHFWNSIQDCWRADGVDRHGNPKTDCCPFREECVQENSNYVCKSEPCENITSCVDYDNPDDCNNDICNVAILEIERETKIEGFCNGSYKSYNESSGCYDFITNCICKWDYDKGKCLSKYTYDEKCGSGSSRKLLANCYREILEKTNCTSGGVIFERFNEYLTNETGSILTCDDDADCKGYVYVEDDLIYCNVSRGLCETKYCKPGTVEYPCLSEALVSFFTITSLVIAIIIIVVFYLVIANKKRNLKKSEKRKNKFSK